MQVGIIGLGLMGSQIAMRLMETGESLWVYNRDRTKADPFADMGVKVADSPRQVAENSDFVITCVTNFESIKSVSFSLEGIVLAKKGAKIVADVSTISPEESIYCAQEFQKCGYGMLSMPVMGGPAAARKGELIPIISGERKIYEKVSHVIEKIGKQAFFINDKNGSANLIKIALNLNIALIATALAEGITLTKAGGIDAGLFIEILNKTYFKTGLSESKGPKMVRNDFQPTFYLKNMLKDLGLVVSTARSIGVSMPLASLSEQLFRAADNSGFSDSDYSAICAFLEKINGLNFDK